MVTALPLCSEATLEPADDVDHAPLVVDFDIVAVNEVSCTIELDAPRAALSHPRSSILLGEGDRDPDAPLVVLSSSEGATTSARQLIARWRLGRLVLERAGAELVDRVLGSSALAPG